MNAPTREAGIISQKFLQGAITLFGGDCLDILPSLPENSVDSIVTDPPYHLVSIVNRFGAEDAAPAKIGKTGAYARASRGFMGKQWDGGDIAFRVELWAQVFRVLKPGGHLLAFSGTRTYHRMACAIEDAGFDVRDMVQWLYGSGFPKSRNISKADNFCCCAREWEKWPSDADHPWPICSGCGMAFVPDGLRAALKPACEPICLARKPLSEPTIAANVLRWGTGALNIDRCRVEAQDKARAPVGQFGGSKIGPNGHSGVRDGRCDALGRWPANIIHDGSEEVVALFPDALGQQMAVGPEHGAKNSVNVFGNYGPRNHFAPRDDSGSAARFFYSAKADDDDRLGSKHPTVKPLDLMQYLCRLITPPSGVVLDPFAGTGTTGEAAWREGFKAILIEREPEYQADIARRMSLCCASKRERRTETLKIKNPVLDVGPLFEGVK